MPEADRETLEIFRDEGLRGCAASGKRFGDSVTLLAELGLVHVDSPYPKAQFAWQPQEGLRLTDRRAKDIRFADIDDPIGEDARAI